MKRRQYAKSYFRTKGRSRERVRKNLRRLKIKYRHRRLSHARAAKYCRRGYNSRKRGRNATAPTPYKWFVKQYGVKDGAKFYREHKRKKHHWRR